MDTSHITANEFDSILTNVVTKYFELKRANARREVAYRALGAVIGTILILPFFWLSLQILVEMFLNLICMNVTDDALVVACFHDRAPMATMMYNSTLIEWHEHALYAFGENFLYWM